MRNVLLITYYWPPSGGVGVQRWLQLSKYLPEYGFRPVILTPENPAVPVQDSSLLQQLSPEVEVLKIPIWEPMQLLQKFKKQPKAGYGVGAEGASSKLLTWLRGNLFIPDPRRFWIKPATEFAQRIVESHRIEAIISTGPPHSMHLVGLELKKRTGLPWLADFRDPWSEWKILADLKPGRWAMRQHRRLEQRVVDQADAVVTTSKHTLEGLRQARKADKFRVIYNGVDYSPTAQDSTLGEEFILYHPGLLNDERNQPQLWEAIGRYNRQAPGNRKVKVKLNGVFSQGVLNSLDKYLSGEDYIADPPVPHAEALRQMSRAGALLLLSGKDPLSQGIIPAKTFEYLAARRPILYLGFAQGEVAGLVATRAYNRVVDSSAGQAQLDSALQDLVDLARLPNTDFKGDTSFAYHRKDQAGEFAQLLNQLLLSKNPAG